MLYTVAEDTERESAILQAPLLLHRLLPGTAPGCGAHPLRHTFLVRPRPGRITRQFRWEHLCVRSRQWTLQRKFHGRAYWDIRSLTLGSGFSDSPRRCRTSTDFWCRTLLHGGYLTCATVTFRAYCRQDPLSFIRNEADFGGAVSVSDESTSRVVDSYMYFGFTDEVRPQPYIYTIQCCLL